MRASHPVRTALVCVLSLLSLAGAGCKARTPAVSAVKADDEANADVSAKGEIATVAKACEGVKNSAFRGIGDGTVIEFSNDAAAATAGETGQKPWYEQATFDGKVWALSATVHGRDGAPECLRASKLLTTRLLIAALGCSSDFTCEAPEALCSGTDCPALDKVAFNNEKPAPTSGPGGGPDTAMALTGEGSVRCDGSTLKTASGAPIGEPLDDATQCETLRATEGHDLVCAWSGKAFLPARANDGVLIGDKNGGLDTPTDCRMLLVLGSHGAVCSWSGKGLAPFAVTNPAEPIGAPDQYGDVLHCMAKTAAAAGGRLCAWDGKSITIFTMASRQPVRELGTFFDYESCHSQLAQVAVQGGLERSKALEENASAPSAQPKGGQEGSGAEGLNLAGGGWTWGECNDSARGFHLVERSGGRLVCEGKVDTLYSWGPKAKISWLVDQPWSGRVQRGGDEKEIFASQSAFATFGYGPYAIRFKLKANTKFRFFDNVAAYSICPAMSASEVDNTVAVRYWKIGIYTGLDFILCGLGPVHSYSYGTQAHYDEMNREVTWMNANNIRNYELYVKTLDASDVTYPQGLDGHAFSGQIWTNQLSWHQSWIPGHVIFNPSVSDNTAAAHFATAWPSYINPGNGGGGNNQPTLNKGGGGGGGGTGKKWFLLNFATASQADRNQHSLEMGVVLEAARQKGVTITCNSANNGGWALQQQCLVDANGETILTAIFPVLTYHQTISFWKNG